MVMACRRWRWRYSRARGMRDQGLEGTVAIVVTADQDKTSTGSGAQTDDSRTEKEPLSGTLAQAGPIRCFRLNLGESGAGSGLFGRDWRHGKVGDGFHGRPTG